jgi:hypothetical protein
LEPAYGYDIASCARGCSRATASRQEASLRLPELLRFLGIEPYVPEAVADERWILVAMVSPYTLKLHDGRTNICLDYGTKVKEAACMSVAIYDSTGTAVHDIAQRP